MVKVLIGKYGQKVFFNRDAEEVNRSNTNGNQGNYRLLSLLFKNNPDVEFWMASANDGVGRYLNGMPNVINAQGLEFEEFPDDFDAAIVIAGLPSYEQDKRYERIVNASSALARRVILLAEDPRCVDAMGGCKRLENFHPIVLSQTDGFVKFGGSWVKTEYVPLQAAIAYGASEQTPKTIHDLRVRDLLVVANSSENKYERISKVVELVRGAGYFFDVFGRLSKEDAERVSCSEIPHMHEVDYDTVQLAFELSLSTLLVPVERDWLTSKYMEALLHGCIPVFYKDYAVRLLSDSEKAVIHACSYVIADAVDLTNAVNDIRKMTSVKYDSVVDTLYKILVAPYVDGKRLSNRIMEEALNGLQ